MLLKDFNLTIPESNRYRSKEWFIQYKDLIPVYLKNRFGRRDLIDDDPEWVEDTIKRVIVEHEYKYDKLWEMLGLAWNPLWNVDGSEELTYTKHVAGENKASGSDSNTLTNTEATFEDSTLKNASGSSGSVTYGRKDNASSDETYTEKRTRAGNIGVTKTQDMILDTLDLLDDDRMSFIYTISHDIVAEICFMC